MSCCGEPKPRKKAGKLVSCLLSCCIFWFVVCACLLTALVFIGKHIVYNSSTGTFSRYPGRVNAPDLSLVNYERLSNDTRPRLYNLTLFPSLDKGDFRGTVNISIDVANESSKIVLHSKALTTSSVRLVRNDSKVFEILSVTENLQDEVLVIVPKERILSGSYYLSIEFQGSLEDKIVGFYRSIYSNDGKKSAIAATKFEPTYARQAFPCFDEPSMKAKYIVHVLKPNFGNYIALSNYPVAKTTPYDNTSELVTFEETVPMSTYVASFIVSDFNYTETKFDNNGTSIPLRVYASPGNLNKTSYAGQVAKKVIEFYISYFNISYPLPKLDMVAVPDFVSGATEHWGLVTYRETSLLYTNTTHSSTNKQRVASVVAHELAHSWFGNLVTMNWWNDLWLNEGFASYIEYKGIHAAEPEWKIMNQFQTADLHPVLSLDATLSSHPIVMPVDTPDAITAIFDLISYNKGAAILRMLEDTVGPDNFQKGVTNYLNKYAYGNAFTNNFLEEIQAVVGNAFNVSELMGTFTVQMGYPVVNVTYDSEKELYTLTQKRFLMDPNATYDASISKYGYNWSIPITYCTDAGRSKELIIFEHFQKNTSIPKPKNANWLKFNADQVGYYRVNYDLPTWRSLIDKFDQMNVTDRTHLLEETFSLAEAGLLTYEIPLNLTKKLANETEYTPWKVASTQLENILGYLKGSSQEQYFKSYIRGIVSPVYNNFTWNETEDDSHSRRLTRITTLSLACRVGHEECLAKAQEIFGVWINDTANPLSPDLRSIVYRFGMLNADEGTWNLLFAAYMAETDSNEKLKMIDGLASVRNITLLERMLDLIKNPQIVRRQDYFIVLGLISANPYGTNIVWDWFRENWESLVERFTLNERYLGQLIPTITSTFSTQEKLDEMNAFFEKYPNAGAGAPNRVTALENVKNNIRWLANYKTTVEAWIRTVTEN